MPEKAWIKKLVTWNKKINFDTKTSVPGVTTA